jgi:hypothetical protein
MFDFVEPAGLAPRVGLPKPIPILVTPLLLNIKIQHKSPKLFYFIFLMSNQDYIMLLA